ncbi:hypothetical protein J4423_01030 [Candidatus Pacearchaeota archaeon]|nr:hypothetical protein [Candidatus Pacearchaeota archaeon]
MNSKPISYVFDSSFLIYFGKVRLLDKIGLLPGIKIIPSEVYNELINIGKDREEQEVDYIINIVENKIFVVRDVENLIVSAPGLSNADAQVLSLAKKTQSIAIIDERYANSLAESYNIETHGLIYMLILLVKEKIISKKVAFGHLDEIIKEGFYLSNQKYKDVIDLISRI